MPPLFLRQPSDLKRIRQVNIRALGWLGVALTGSDTASNVLFGGLQKITAEQTGVRACLKSSGGPPGLP